VAAGFTAGFVEGFVEEISKAFAQQPQPRQG
jgi:hypothetical protein